MHELPTDISAVLSKKTVPERASKKDKRRKGEKKMARVEPTSSKPGSKQLSAPMIEPAKITYKGKHKKVTEPPAAGKNVFSFDPHLLLGIPSESD